MSDDFLCGDDFDDAFLAEIDAIEAAETATPTSLTEKTTHGTGPVASSHQSRNIPPRFDPQSRRTPNGHVGQSSKTLLPRAPLRRQDSDEFDLSFDVDETQLAQIDQFVEAEYAKAPEFRADTTRQTTLFGAVLPRQPIQRTRSDTGNSFGRKLQKIKKWDHTEFAKTGLKPKPKKGKDRQSDEELDEDESEELEFEQFPAPFVSGSYL